MDDEPRKGGRGRALKDKNVANTHLGDKWENLGVEKRAELIRRIWKAFNEWLDNGTPIPADLRTWARRAPALVPEMTTHSFDLAASLLINLEGRTVCPYHTMYERGTEVHHDYNNDPTETFYQVTGVPHRPLKDVKANSKEGTPAVHTRLQNTSYLDRPTESLPSGKKRKRSTWNENFTRERILSFFPMYNGRYGMHCGCDLDEVMIDFVLWKTVKIESYSHPHLVEGWGEGRLRPMKPRDRAFVAVLVTRVFCYDFHYFFDFDSNGHAIDMNRRLRHHARILKNNYEATIGVIRDGIPSVGRKDLQLDTLDSDEENGRLAEKDSDEEAIGIIRLQKKLRLEDETGSSSESDSSASDEDDD
ncbi:hypothetical protein DFP72DRAFT_887987 [Ephemerocybe angulata]|uniref:Uncharacterized protein n=1 Tax=Ephemerocybe angulata TaxID=980116 RepID=A0A8H6I4E5_9AGAR|nr:hypothetical protein DFP72DRAFT_887987 [Tulosesus angulatus]